MVAFYPLGDLTVTSYAVGLMENYYQYFGLLTLLFCFPGLFAVRKWRYKILF